MHLSAPAAVYTWVYLGTPLVASQSAVCGITMGNSLWQVLAGALLEEPNAVYG